MRMIEKVMRSMRDTGLLDGMSDEDCDTVATAALEEFMATPEHFEKQGYEFSIFFKDEFDKIITMAFEE